MPPAWVALHSTASLEKGIQPQVGKSATTSVH